MYIYIIIYIYIYITRISCLPYTSERCWEARCIERKKNRERKREREREQKQERDIWPS